jgi:hypothetical protein
LLFITLRKKGMLENLFNLIKENGSDVVINNPIIPNEQNDAVIADATHSVADGLQGVLAGGGLQNVLSLFNNGGNNAGGNGLLNNPIVSNIISSFTDKLSNNHGIAGDQASGIANSLIPNVLSNLINKTNDPNNSSFDIGGIISSLTGGGGAQAGSSNFDLNGLIGNFTSGGLDANNDGHVGLDDIISKVTGGAQQQQTQSGGNGLMDVIQGFMK